MAVTGDWIPGLIHGLEELGGDSSLCQYVLRRESASEEKVDSFRRF